jgi:hypothetical protein
MILYKQSDVNSLSALKVSDDCVFGGQYLKTQENTMASVAQANTAPALALIF